MFSEPRNPFSDWKETNPAIFSSSNERSPQDRIAKLSRSAYRGLPKGKRSKRNSEGKTFKGNLVIRETCIVKTLQKRAFKGKCSKDSFKRETP